MRRTTPIRITKNDREEHARLARKAKAKIRRTNKTYGIDLSEKVKIYSIEDFGTRAEYNAWKDRISRFTNRYTKEYQFEKNERGFVANKQELYEFKKANEKARVTAMKKNEKLKKETFFVRGKAEGTIEERQRLKKDATPVEISVPDVFDFNEIADRKEFDQKLESMKKRADPAEFDKRMNRFKRVFERELEENFNSDAQRIIELLEYIPDDDFYYIYQKNNEEFNYTMFYPPEGVVDDENSLKQIRRMESVLKEYLTGKYNMDLKGF